MFEECEALLPVRAVAPPGHTSLNFGNLTTNARNSCMSKVRRFRLCIPCGTKARKRLCAVFFRPFMKHSRPTVSCSTRRSCRVQGDLPLSVWSTTHHDKRGHCARRRSQASYCETATLQVASCEHLGVPQRRPREAATGASSEAPAQLQDAGLPFAKPAWKEEEISATWGEHQTSTLSHRFGPQSC